MPRVYLAGPDVFLPDPLAFAEKKKDLCRTYGFEGVFPLDAVLDLAGLSPREAGLRIAHGNEELIRSAELVIAQVTPFRGPSADVGTAYEMGFARALGLPVFAYTNDAQEFSARTKAFSAGFRTRADGSLEDADHLQIESFELADNLMLVGGVADSGGHLAVRAAVREERYTDLVGFEECLKAASRLFGPATKST